MSSANVSRRFGTDVSNIPSNYSSTKTPKKSTVKSTPNSKSSSKTPDSQLSKRTCFDGLESLMDTLATEISLDDEITIKSPAKSSASVVDYFRYERDFLMQFKEVCNEPIEGLLPEVVPGFQHPEAEPLSDFTSPVKNGRSKFAPTTPKFDLSISSESTKASKALSPRDKTSTQVSVAPTTPVGTEDQSSNLDSSIPIAASVSFEWRAKKVKKQKPREQDSRRLAARQKQIDIGMNTVGYKRFTESVPAEARTKAHPKIPDINQVCSKRSWDGQVRKWRRQLHDYDPEAAGQTEDGLNAAERHTTGASSEEEYSSEHDDEDYEEEVIA